MTCSVARCERPSHCRGLCRKHYTRWFRHGDPLVVLRTRNDHVARRFWSKVVKEGSHGCWRWQGRLNHAGYGRFTVGGRRDARWVMAHRFAYELLIGPIPEGLELDHLCRQRDCVNPGHMEPVTREENSRRGVEDRRLEATR